MRYIDFSSVKETIGKIYFGICICVFAYAVIGVPILLGMLKKHGVKTEAVITPNTSSWVHRILMTANVIWMLEKQDYNQQQYTEELSFGKELNKN